MLNIETIQHLLAYLDKLTVLSSQGFNVHKEVNAVLTALNEQYGLTV